MLVSEETARCGPRPVDDREAFDKGGVYVIHAQDIRARFRRYYDAAVEDE